MRSFNCFSKQFRRFYLSEKSAPQKCVDNKIICMWLSPIVLTLTPKIKSAIFKMKTSRLKGILDDLCEFFGSVVHISWDTVYVICDMTIEYLLQTLELAVALLGLFFEIIILFRNICIDALDTFARMLQNIILMIADISCEEIEEFVQASLIIAIWIFLGRVFVNYIINMMSSVKKNVIIIDNLFYSLFLLYCRRKVECKHCTFHCI